MKKFILLILMLIMPLSVKAALPQKTDLDYAEAQKMIKEVMKAYYIKEEHFQYNYAKAQYGVHAPEDATSQDIKYLVCAAFTYTSYVEAFGTKYIANDSEFPRYNYDISDQAAAYYTANKDKSDKLDGNFLIYYENTTTDAKAKYIYKNATKLSDFVEIIKPGDLFVYSGHALIAYDVVTNPKTNKKDVLILNSTADDYIRTRIDGTSKLSHTFFPSPTGANNVLDVNKEGTVQFIWLSSINKFVKDGNISCTTEECAVLRIFYPDENNKTVFNFQTTDTQITKTQLRLEYPGLHIEKTVNVNDNDSVRLGDELTYTIKVTNKSDVSTTSEEKSYEKFYIEEILSEYVTYENSNGTHQNDTVTWNIEKLEPGKTVTLTYTVKVKEDYNNLNKIIKSTGRFYKDNLTYITTGVVENKIIPKVTSQKKSYQECYKNITTESGLELIDAVYACAYDDVDFSFKDFDFTKVFTKSTAKNPSKGTAKLIYPTDKNNIYYKMILNNYWSGTFYQQTNEIFYLPRWSGEDTNTRARTINPSDLKDGDVLLYYVDYSQTKESLRRTHENGLYAYIYIDGKFVRKNVTAGDREEFTHEYYAIEENLSKFYGLTDSACKNYENKTICNYYYNLYGGITKLTENNKDEILSFVNYQTLYDKDYYMILRPELLIKESTNITVKTDSLEKTSYLEKTDSLDLTGGEIVVQYNDGTVETIAMSNENVKITGFDNTVAGVNTLTIEYNGHTTTLDVKIVSMEQLATEDIPDTGATIYLGIILLFAGISIYVYVYLKHKNKFVSLD